MILPDTLHPLPVSSDESGRQVAREDGGFVNESEVRQLLVGPLATGRVPTCYDGDDGGFAGRVESPDSPFVSLAADEAYDEAPAKPFVPGGVETPVARRAAAPHPRKRDEDGETPASRPWVVSAAMLFVGALVGSVLFTLQAPFAPDPPAPVVPASVADDDGPSLATSDAGMP